MALYEALFREYILMEELTWLNSQIHQKYSGEKSINHGHLPGDNISDLINSYQEKISSLNEEVMLLKDEIQQRDQELVQLQLQSKINKQRSRSLEKLSNENNDEGNRTRRGMSVDGGENLREELNTSIDENRLLKGKLLKLEDQLNNFVLVGQCSMLALFFYRKNL